MKLLRTMIICTFGLLCATSIVQGQNWVKRYDGSAHKSDFGNKIAVDSSNNVYVMGSSYGDNDQDIVLIKYDANGNSVWSKRYDGSAHSYDNGHSLAIDSIGNIYITGYSYGGTDTSGDIITLKYDTKGNRLWAKRYDSPMHKEDEGSSLAVDTAGNVYVGGDSDGGTLTSFDTLTIKYSTDGKLLWVKRYDGPAHGLDVINSIALDSSGNIYATGYTDGDFTTGRDVLVIKYDSNGNRLWLKRYDGTAHQADDGYALALDSSNNVYVLSRSQGRDSNDAINTDIVTLKYSTNGKPLWAKRYDGPAHGNDFGYAMVVDTIGNVYITGSSNGGTATKDDFITLKYDTNGTRLWAKRYDGTAHGYDYGQAIVIDISGIIWVTGSAYISAKNKDLVLLGYDSSGTLKYGARYDGSAQGDDWSSAMTTTITGAIYITGASYTSATRGYDILTLLFANGDGNSF